jgi:hypothetical protein
LLFTTYLQPVNNWLTGIGHNRRLLYQAINSVIGPETLNPVRSLTLAKAKKEGRFIKAKLIEDLSYRLSENLK